MRTIGTHILAALLIVGCISVARAQTLDSISTLTEDWNAYQTAQKHVLSSLSAVANELAKTKAELAAATKELEKLKAEAAKPVDPK